MKIIVIHVTGEEAPTHRAVVTTPAALGDRIDKHLQYAYRWTQNTGDSWSYGDGEDRNPNVQRLGPLHPAPRRGIRSTMVGDRLLVDGVTWVVAPDGFRNETFGEKPTDLELLFCGR
tara:strand:+ start:398 stop:748 length:351 start_codon:yes stop_codon:yes gene_type:complete